MMSYDALLIVLVSVFALTVLIILLIVLNNSRKTNDLNNELSRSIFEIRSSLNRDLSDFNSAMNSRFVDFSERVNSNLIQSHKASNEVFNTINEKMVRISKAQETIDELSRDIISLQDILTDKKVRCWMYDPMPPYWPTSPLAFCASIPSFLWKTTATCSIKDWMRKAGNCISANSGMT